MALSQMQPDPHGHENAGRDQRARDRLAPENDRKDGAHERRRREVGAGTRAPEIAQGSTKNTRLRPYPKKPRTSAAAARGADGAAPRPQRSPPFPAPRASRRFRERRTRRATR